LRIAIRLQYVPPADAAVAERAVLTNLPRFFMHKFSPDRAEKLEQTDRYTVLPPEQVLSKLGLRRNMSFADIGAGTGFFARAASEIVGEGGRVYAVDMSAEMLSHLKERGEPANMTTVESKEYTIPLESDVVDFSLMAFVVHETEDTPRFLAEVQRITRTGGRIAIVEWEKQQEEHGPPMEERMSREEVIGRLVGFAVVASGILTASHYFILIEVNK